MDNGAGHAKAKRSAYRNGNDPDAFDACTPSGTRKVRGGSSRGVGNDLTLMERERHAETDKIAQGGDGWQRREMEVTQGRNQGHADREPGPDGGDAAQANAHTHEGFRHRTDQWQAAKLPSDQVIVRKQEGRPLARNHINATGAFCNRSKKPDVPQP